MGTGALVLLYDLAQIDAIAGGGANLKKFCSTSSVSAII